MKQIQVAIGFALATTLLPFVHYAQAATPPAKAAAPAKPKTLTPAELKKLRNENSAMSTGEVQFMAASEDILLVLRWNHNDRDAFGRPAQRNACLCVVNRSRRDSCFEADCSNAGIGRYSGWIQAESARYVKLIRRNHRFILRSGDFLTICPYIVTWSQ